MESLIGLVNRIQRACTALGDHGDAEESGIGLPTLWEALPSVVVVGGQVTSPSFDLFVSLSWFLLSVVPDVGLRAEFGKVFGPGEHRRERLPSPWFWYASVALGSRLLCFHVFS